MTDTRLRGKTLNLWTIACVSTRHWHHSIEHSRERLCSVLYTGPLVGRCWGGRANTIWILATVVQIVEVHGPKARWLIKNPVTCCATAAAASASISTKDPDSQCYREKHPRYPCGIGKGVNSNSTMDVKSCKRNHWHLEGS